MPNELQIALTFAALGLVFGLAIGRVIEGHFGKKAKDCTKYHEAILRMIPKLKNYYTSDYIYWELIEGGKNRHEDDHER